MISAESIRDGLNIILKMETVPWFCSTSNYIYAGDGRPGEVYDDRDVADLNRLGWRWNEDRGAWEHPV